MSDERKGRGLSNCHNAETYDGIAQGEVMDESGKIHIEDICLVVCSQCHQPCNLSKVEGKR